MAPIRITSTLQRRRRSSLALNPFTPAKPGLYGINRPVTFAPNITPVTFTEPEDGADMDNLSSILSSPDSDSSPAAIFPPSVDDASSALGMTTTRKRCPPGKRRSQGYIPRPPNAFMLFRADFVRQKHVPGSIETNHGSLSKIIGNCWRALPLDEKRIWEVKAKHAKAEHKARYPNYRFRPVHNKNKDGKKKEKEKNQTAVDDERRCEEVAQLLLEGKKGEELAAAIRDLDGMRSQTPPAQQQQQQQHYYPPRRPSSVPLPNDYFTYFPNIALPSLASFPSRPASPVSISQQQQQQRQRGLLGARRPSSAGPTMMERSWTMPAFNTMGTVHNHQMMFQQDFQHDFHTPLPDADESLFNFSWSSSGAVMSSSSSTDHSHQHVLQAPIPISSHHGLDNLGPLGETLVAPMQILPPGASDVASELGMSWMQMGLESLDACSQLNSLDSSISKPSSIYSSSPEPADDVLLAHQHHHQHQYQQQQQQQQQNMYHPESYAGQDLFSGFNNTSGLDALFAADDSQQACFDPTAATLSILHHHPAGHQHNALYDFVHE